MTPIAGQTAGPRTIALASASIVLALMVGACAPKAPRTAPAGPMFPQYEFPTVSEALAGASGELVTLHQEAWGLLQAGSARAAERRFSSVIRRAPDFYPSTAGLGYTALAQQDFKQALEHFDQSLAVVPDYLPALLGRAEALQALNQIPEAVAAFDAVVRADPARTELKAKADSLRFRSIEDLVAQAGTAQREGRLDEARVAWERALQASPDSAYLYRELAGVERLAAQLDRAYEHAQRARQLDDRDAATHVLIGEIEEARGRLKEARDAYQQASTLGRTDLGGRMTDLERRIALAAMPEAFKSIPGATRVTRGDLAALLGVRLEHWIAKAPPVNPGLLTDVRDHWAQRWILAVTRAGLMEVYPNHTFQPAELVQRADLAGVVSRALAVAAQDGRAQPTWLAARPTFSDLEPAHASYPAAAMAVSAGVLPNGPENAFQPTRPVSGAEAVAAVDRLEAVVGRQ